MGIPIDLLVTHVSNFMKFKKYDHLGPKIPTNLKQILGTKIVHTYGSFLETFRKNVRKSV